MFFKHHSSKIGFTLAELLVAIAIISVMFALALPAVTGLVGNAKLDSGADAVLAATRFARQHATARRQPAYLVLNTDPSSPDLAYRAYAVYTIDIHSPPVTASDGYFIMDWTSLPEGVVFDPDINRERNIFDASNGRWQGALTRDNRLLIDGASHATMGFKPNGQAASATRHVHVSEGVGADGEVVVFPEARGKQIHLTTFGKTVVLDYVRGEDGALNLLGGAR